jgi:peptidoglycan DL-endopeptidase LytF
MYLSNTSSFKYLTIIVILTIMLLPGCATNTPVYTSTKNAETEVYHYAEKGQTIYDIATIWGRNYLDIARWNNLSPPYKINEHQKLLVSGPPSAQDSADFFETVPITPSDRVVASRLKPPPKTSASPKKPATYSTPAPKPALASTPLTLKKNGKTYHKVQRRETLYSIAKHYGQDYHDVAGWNDLSFPFDLALGRELLVSPPSSSSATSSRQDKATATFTAPKPKLAGKYVVQPHDTLYSVAKRAGYSMADIMAWNDLQSRELTIGQTLIVGPPTSSSFVPTQAEATANYHTIAPGETVYSLSKRYGYNVEQIVQWNNLSPSYNLSRGQRVRVSPPDKTVLRQFAKNAGNAGVCHKVVKEETLYSISKNAGYAVADVAKWNGIPWPYILKIGQTLRVSPATGANSCN